MLALRFTLLTTLFFSAAPSHSRPPTEALRQSALLEPAPAVALALARHLLRDFLDMSEKISVSPQGHEEINSCKRPCRELRASAALLSNVSPNGDCTFQNSLGGTAAASSSCRADRCPRGRGTSPTRTFLQSRLGRSISKIRYRIPTAKSIKMGCQVLRLRPVPPPSPVVAPVRGPRAPLSASRAALV